MKLNQTYIAEHDYYDMLGLENDATSIEVQEAFERLTNKLDLQDPSHERRYRAAEKNA